MQRARRQSRLGKVTAAGVGVLFVAALGCEAIVGDSVPSPVMCVAGVGACPVGQECVAGQCAPCTTVDCVPTATHDAGEDTGQDAGHDATVPSVDAGLDAGHDVGIDVPVMAEAAPPPLKAIGQGCEADDDCMSGLCVAANEDLDGVTVASTSVCSLACCTSADCGAGNVCYPTEAGGLCITASAAETCGNQCGTACCTQDDCGGGEACALSMTSFGGSVASCQPSGGGGGEGDFCESDTDCAEGVCDSDNGCVSANTCCSARSKCSGSDVCTWVTVPDSDGTSTPVFRGCLDIDAGTVPSGQPCTDPNECADGFCLMLPGQTASLCTKACCTNADCTNAGARWICEPDSLPLSSDTHVSLFVCGPPS